MSLDKKDKQQSSAGLYVGLGCLGIVAVLLVVFWPFLLLVPMYVGESIHAADIRAADDQRDEFVVPLVKRYVMEKYGIDVQVEKKTREYGDQEKFDPPEHAEATLFVATCADGEQFAVRAGFTVSGASAADETTLWRTTDFSDTYQYANIVQTVGAAAAKRLGLPNPRQVFSGGEEYFTERFGTEKNDAGEDEFEKRINTLELVYGDDVDLGYYKDISDKEAVSLLGELTCIHVYSMKDDTLVPEKKRDVLYPGYLAMEQWLWMLLPHVQEHLAIDKRSELYDESVAPSLVTYEMLDDSDVPLWGTENMKRQYVESGVHALPEVEESEFSIIGDVWKAGVARERKYNGGIAYACRNYMYIPVGEYRNLEKRYSRIAVAYKMMDSEYMAGPVSGYDTLNLPVHEGKEYAGYVAFVTSSYQGTAFALIGKERKGH